MANKDIILSIAICSLGRSQSLNTCLKSLEKQTQKKFEIIVVSDQKPDYELDGIPVRWVKDPGKGLSVARDLGWRRARGEIVAWIDDDVVVSRNWAKELLATFRTNPEIGGVSGPTIIPPELIKNRHVFWWYNRPNHILAKLWIRYMLDNDPHQVGKLTNLGWWTPGSNFASSLRLKGFQDVDYLEACNMAIRRDLVKKVGGYDLNYKGTSEWCEVDLAIRVKNLGCRLVFNPKVSLEHHVSKSGVYIKRNNIAERLANYLHYRQKHFV